MHIMNHLEYKGYYGSIEFSKEDKRLYGSVLGMTRDSITFEGNTVEELENDFINAIESYMEGCRELGIKPRKGASCQRKYAVINGIKRGSPVYS